MSMKIITLIGMIQTLTIILRVGLKQKLGNFLCRNVKLILAVEQVNMYNSPTTLYLALCCSETDILTVLLSFYRQISSCDVICLNCMNVFIVLLFNVIKLAFRVKVSH